MWLKNAPYSVRVVSLSYGFERGFDFGGMVGVIVEGSDLSDFFFQHEPSVDTDKQGDGAKYIVDVKVCVCGGGDYGEGI